VLDYYYLLRYDDPDGVELDRLVEALLVHETYFFREHRSLEVALDHAVLPALASGRRARVWSAACSTGEEPLSVAMMLADRGVLDRCEIVASDISSDTLAVAARGRYRHRSLREEGHPLADRWLERDGAQIVVPRALLDAVHFRRINLCDDAAVAAQGTFDLVLCRQLFIYFSDSTIARVIGSLTERLRVGGILLVGVTESLLRFSTGLRCEEIDGAFVYRRVD
jgi:chemotaxis protein methyltransferase CheR